MVRPEAEIKRAPSECGKCMSMYVNVCLGLFGVITQHSQVANPKPAHGEAPIISVSVETPLTQVIVARHAESFLPGP